MNKKEEKIRATKVLYAAVKSIDEARKAIDEFADAFGITEEKKQVDLCDLTEMVHEECGMARECAYITLSVAFDLIREKGLTVVVKEKEDEEDDK